MSQFDGLFKKTEAVGVQTAEPRVSKPKATAVAEMPVTIPTPVATNGEKKKVGKSADPLFTQALTYVKKDTLKQVKATLIFDEQDRDLSDLVDELLTGWLKKNQRKQSATPLTHL